ncbi:hypothetical protein V8E52_005446 [Russula decolorans]
MVVASGEKDILITAAPSPFQQAPTRWSKWTVTAVGFVALLARIFAMAFFHHAYLRVLYYGKSRFLSAVPVVLLGSHWQCTGSRARLWKSLGRGFDDDVFMTRAVAWLGGAVRIPHKSLTLTKVNTYGLLYEWKGSDDGLKPLLLTGHQDVVPVEPETVDEWEHPRYSGYYDGKFIWGRGSSDDTSGVIGILASIETLLEKTIQTCSHCRPRFWLRRRD